jgi:6-phosphogluconate dehydrogenase
MQIAMVGLGRMGANMARRLLRAGHECVVYNRTPEPVAQLVAEGATGVASLAELAEKLTPPRAAWVMVPAGEVTERVVMELAALFAPGDVIIDGGNSYFKDDIRRAGMLAERGIDYLDAGTSGGVWGLERGYCLMVGGHKPAYERLEPIFRSLAPGDAGVPASPGRTPGSSAEQGYLHCGPSGAGHFAKMVHNGIEYGLMQAYAEGFDIPQERQCRSPSGSAALRLRPGGYRRIMAPGQRRHLLVARPVRRGPGARSGLGQFQRLCPGFRRGPLDGAGGHR